MFLSKGLHLMLTVSSPMVVACPVWCCGVGALWWTACCEWWSDVSLSVYRRCGVEWRQVFPAGRSVADTRQTLSCRDLRLQQTLTLLHLNTLLYVPRGVFMSSSPSLSPVSEFYTSLFVICCWNRKLCSIYSVRLLKYLYGSEYLIL